jgi:Cd2+/Zn2+-exporting ATPase
LTSIAMTNSQPQLLSFRIAGMDCAEEVALLKRELGPMVGGEDRLSFDILQARLDVLPAAAQVSEGTVMEAVARTGMRAEVWQDRPQPSVGFWRRHAGGLLTALCGVLGCMGFLFHAWLGGGIAAALGSEGTRLGGNIPLPAAMFYLAGIAAGIRHVAPKAWRAAVGLRPDMNLLMTIAILGAVAIGEWFEAATVAFLYSLSLVLETWSVGRARRAIASLMDLTPPMARLRRPDGGAVEVPAEEVAIGSVVVVRPGEKVPLDGRVVQGASDVNQAPVTGESLPIHKSPSADVFAGSINGDGVLEIECTKPARDSTLAHIIRMVGQAQSRRAPSEKWVERFARVYTPTVMVLAAGVLLLPPLVWGGPWLDWLYRALVLLVIACPCALVISTPISVVAALAAAARNGVLIKGGVFIEAPAALKAIALDKTGTLTAGEPTVVDVVPMSGHNERELLERAVALESHSNHPLARAIVAAAETNDFDIPSVADYEIVQGKGASGRIGGTRYWLGSHRYLEERGQETPEVHDRLEAMQRAGRTVVVIGNDSHVCGLIALADSLRPEAIESLGRLRGEGIEHLVMLTGDNRGTAEAIAHEAGMDEVHAELLPADKVQVVESLVAKYGHVAMIGDGINDAPALARASVGIAMGAAGSDAAIETADIALMSDDLAKLPWLIAHSRRTVAVIRQNITFALAVKVVFVILTLIGTASLWAAIAADMGASLLVIFNGLRLLRGGR